MWFYKDVSREEFEKVKDRVEEIMIAHGAVATDVKSPFSQGTISLNTGSDDVFWEGDRRLYKFRDLYYRLDEVCFPEKPFIVAEVGTYEEVMNNTMEDAEPFPYDLSLEELDDEVSYFLGEKPYPDE